MHQEAAQLVEPERAIDAVWRRGDLESGLSGDGCRMLLFASRGLVVEGLEMLLELEWRVELCGRQQNPFPGKRNKIPNTSESGIRGRPAAMSAALLPGRILLDDVVSSDGGNSLSWVDASLVALVEGD